MPSLSRPITRLYSRYLTPQEKHALRRVPMNDVSSEINLVRVLTALFMKLQQSAPPDLISRMQGLQTYLILSETLALLVRSLERDHGSQSKLDAILAEALDNVPFEQVE